MITRLFARTWLFPLLLLTPALALGVDGVYLGGEVGNMALTGDLGSRYNNAIGFGVDLGVRTNSLLDVTAHFQHSSHSGLGNGININDLFLSADLHAFGFNDFEFSFAFGPGFYFFNTPSGSGPLGAIPSSSSTFFGLNFGAIGDVDVTENVRIGLDGRYHVVFNNSPGGNLWTIMLRAGYLFDVQ